MSTREQTQAYYDKHASQYDQRTGFGGNTGQEYNFTRYFAPFLIRGRSEEFELVDLGIAVGMVDGAIFWWKR